MKKFWMLKEKERRRKRPHLTMLFEESFCFLAKEQKHNKQFQTQNI